eukprot:CAMPEP_0184304352 /NCGR_PEP_ID=MMETSP1049-20130417/13896_1 /TAXON_ID=77928 /ORGANISM="Proteomonas sulcata, Strain CCMP704" /LENGTH=206 /DNA_ID=CAMNT_0026616145 /DNA_START=148 /DNA_END=768 /DNA_ORIENTATION=+
MELKRTLHEEKAAAWLSKIHQSPNLRPGYSAGGRRARSSSVHSREDSPRRGNSANQSCEDLPAISSARGERRKSSGFHWPFKQGSKDSLGQDEGSGAKGSRSFLKDFASRSLSPMRGPLKRNSTGGNIRSDSFRSGSPGSRPDTPKSTESQGGMSPLSLEPAPPQKFAGSRRHRFRKASDGSHASLGSFGSPTAPDSPVATTVRYL